MNPVATHKTHDPALTRKLDSALENWVNDKSLQSFLEVRNKYRELLTGTITVATADAALLYTPRILEIFSESKQTLPIWMSREILDLLTEDGNLTIYLTLANSEQMLAWFCCDRAALITFRDDIARIEEFKDLLFRWTGHQFSDKERPTLDNVSTLLYGPACWELYGKECSPDDDPDDVDMLGREIAELGLPLMFKNDASTRMRVSVDLPDDMQSLDHQA